MAHSLLRKMFKVELLIYSAIILYKDKNKGAKLNGHKKYEAVAHSCG